MKRAKRSRLLAALLTVAMLTSMLPMLAVAAEPDDGTDEESGIMLTAGDEDTTTATSGNCGAPVSENGEVTDAVTWSFDSTTGTLTISGSGAMADYALKSDDDEGEYRGETPWMHLSDSIKTVVISEGVTRIGQAAFLDQLHTVLENVYIAKSVTVIGKQAFQACQSLKSVVFAENAELTEMEPFVFDLCTSLTEITIPANVTKLDRYVFSRCSALEQVTFAGSEKLTTIEYNCFEKTSSLSEILIPKSVTSLGHHAFAESGLSSVQFEIGITLSKLEQGTFSKCNNLTNIVLPESVTEIGVAAFQNCHNLTNVTLGSSLTSIGNQAFQFCEKLYTITLPDSVTSIGSQLHGFYSATVNRSNILALGYTNAGIIPYGLQTSETIPGDYTYTARGWYDLSGKYYYVVVPGLNSYKNEMTEKTTVYAVYGTTISTDSNNTNATGTDASVNVYFSPGLNDDQTIDGNAENYLSATAPENPYTLNGYSFSGWNTKADGSGTSYAANASLPVTKEPMVLYAQWTKKIGENIDYTVNAIPDQVYTGEEIEPAVLVKKGGEVLDSGYTVTYSNNINVGMAKATVTIGTDSAEVEFQITKDNNTAVELADVSVTYGTSYNMDATAKTSAGNEIKNSTISIKYYTDEACTEGETEELPTNVGTYYAKAVLTGTDNYAEASKIAKITISNADFSVTAEGYDGVYDGQEHSITVEADGSTVTYSTDGTNYSDTNPSFTDVGTYTVYYKAAKANYNDVTGSVNVTIFRANQALSFAESTLTVHISAVTATNALNHAAGDGAVTYSSSNEEVAAVDADGQVIIKGVGETTITAAAARTNNYNEVATSYTLIVENHTYDESWESDENGHWQECAVCGEKTTVLDHTFQWVIDKEATAADKGSKHEECSVCHYKKESVVIPAIGNAGKTDDNKSDNKTDNKTGNSSKAKTTSAQTGDSSHVGIWFSLLAVSLLGIGAMLFAVVLRKRTYHDQ